MENKTKIRVPKKYEHMIQSIHFESDNGYWVYLADGFYSPNTGCGTIHEYTQKDVLSEIRKIKAETYDLREEDGMYYEVNMTFEEAVKRYKTLRKGQQMYSRHTGDKVECIWSFESLKREPSIVAEELEEEIEYLENKLQEGQQTGCGGFEYTYTGEDREEIEAEISRLQEAVRGLYAEMRKAEEEERMQIVNKMVEEAEALYLSDSIKIDHYPQFGELYVKFLDGEENEYAFRYSEYEELYKEYEESCLYEHLHFEQYIAYVSQSW